LRSRAHPFSVGAFRSAANQRSPRMLRRTHVPREDTVTHSAAYEASLSLTSRTNRGGYVIATLSGDLGIASASALREQIHNLLRAASHLIIDLSAVEHADASGLAALVGSGRRARLLGGSLRLAAPSPEVARVLSATGINRYLDIFPTVRAATASQPGQPGPVFPAGSYVQRPTRPSAVTTGRQASGRAGRRDVWSRPGEDLVGRGRVSGWS
jgi:anti-sigma B factor antagonist